MNHYDYVVVGGGPSGLAFAQCAQSVGKRVVIIDAESAIGGCHRGEASCCRRQAFIHGTWTTSVQ